MNLRERECERVDWIHLITIWWRALVNMVRNLQVPYNTENSLTN